MAEAMKGPKVPGEAIRLLDSAYLLIDVHPFVPVATGKDVSAAGAWMRLQEFPGLTVQGNFLILPPFGVPDMDEAPLKINIIPFEPKEFSPPHAGKEGQFHQFNYSGVGGFLQ